MEKIKFDKEFIIALLKTTFIKYLIIGAVFTIVTTAILWFFVDIVGVLASAVNVPLTLSIFFLKYYLYKKSIFKRGKSTFLIYVIIAMIILVISTGCLFLFVDILKYPVVIVNPIVVVFTFFLRFGFYKLVRITS